MIVEQMLKNAQIPLLHIADVSGSALFNADCMDILPLIPDKSGMDYKQKTKNYDKR